MTTKTDDIKLPPLPERMQDVAAWLEAHNDAEVARDILNYARAAVEADRQGRMPSDDDVATACKSLGWDLDAQEEADMILLVRTVMSRYSSGQPKPSNSGELERPAASAEPVYAFRRKGQDEFVTCGPERFAELQAKPHLFETRIFYAAPVAQEPVATTGRTHSLKTDPEVFQAVFEGLKTFEIRVNDRGFRVGDELLLKETTRTGAEIKDGAPLEYTGRTCRRAVSHILTGYGLAENWCCLSFAAPVATQAQPTGYEEAGSFIWDGDEWRMAAAKYGEDPDVVTLYKRVNAQDEPQQSGISGELPSAQDREDAERYRWATALDDNSETLHSIVLSYGGDQAKINERVDVYRACDARAAKGADHG
ncbi:MAG: DUF3850 domain-containing protein [Castellaniella sp.]|nr:DUF3850 domain-containing protein [Castellaniella sp.]